MFVDIGHEDDGSSPTNTAPVCSNGCLYVWDPVDKIHRSTGESCGSGEGGGGGSNDSPPNNGGGSNSGGGSGNGSGSGDGNGENPGNGSGGGSGDGDNEENPGNGSPTDGDPDVDTFDPLACKSEDDYWHHCIDSDGDYWIYDDYINTCSKSDEDWDEFEICAERNGNYVFFKYKAGNGDTFSNTDYFETQYDMCIHRFVRDVDGSDIDEDQLPYCANRYLSGHESNLYDKVFSGFMNPKEPDEDEDDNDTDDSKTIDLRKRLGISENGGGSLSSAIPDLLGHAQPKKSGEHGVCLDDIEVEIGDEIIVLEISRVCPWLNTLGTIFVFISLFIAFQIVARD